jgi:hypothetical protein
MANLGSKLLKNMVMNPGDTLVSPGGLYTVTMLPTGDLVLAETAQPEGPWIWSAGTAGNNNATCKMLGTGDLVISNVNLTHIAHSATNSTNSTFVVDDTGKVSILNQTGNPLWVNGLMKSFNLSPAAKAVGA